MTPPAWSRLLPTLLDFERSPGRYRVVLREPRPLFEHTGCVMLLATGRPVEGLPAALAKGLELRRAARFFVRTVMLRSLVVAAIVTLATLILGAMVGIVMARHRGPAKRLLLSLMTLPLSFPGVIVGFFIILLGGRQGLLAQITQDLGLGRVTFAYGLLGLFLAYLYFSLPRAIATITEKGGTVLHGPQEVPGGAFIAMARDPHGAHFAVVGPA